jgi:hypothetical protein
MINLIVSIDGIPKYHDNNRGKGNWEKSTQFIKKALSMEFHAEVFSIATKENIPQIEVFESLLFDEVGATLPITYHPRKPMSYLSNHPVSNRIGSTDDFSFPNMDDRKLLGGRKLIFPPLNLGCYQVSLMSNGKVFGCCEGIRPLGSISDDPTYLLAQLQSRIGGPCLGCVEPDFMCGLKAYYAR